MVCVTSHSGEHYARHTMRGKLCKTHHAVHTFHTWRRIKPNSPVQVLGEVISLKQLQQTLATLRPDL